jgi:predicted methyltransferase
MSANRRIPRSVKSLGLLFAAMSLSFIASAATDIYTAAVDHAGRSESDKERDATDKPAEVLRLGGIKPGMTVLDFLAGAGYYSELLSYIVGPTGHVVMYNNAQYLKWSEGWEKRFTGNRLPNVERKTTELNNIGLGENVYDAVIMVKSYHDLYMVDPKEWPKVNVPATLDQVVRAMKPGATLLLIDHSAKAGTGSKDANELHRIDEAYAKKEFEAHGLKLVAEGQMLRKPEDKRDAITYKGPIVGKTDRFVLVFRKTA